MAEAARSNPREGHVIAAAEQPRIAQETNPQDLLITADQLKNLSPEKLKSVYDLVMGERIERLRQERAGTLTVPQTPEETPEVPTVPLATGSGGGTKPPGPENEKVVDLYPPTPKSPEFDNLTNRVSAEADRLAQDREERERADRAVAETNAAIEANIAEEKVIEKAPQSQAPYNVAEEHGKLLNNLHEIQYSPIPSNSAPEIPSQTEPNPLNPAFIHPENESMLDTAARLGKNAAEYVGDKLSDSMQYGILGKLEPKLDRLGIRLLNAPRRLALGVLYRWRSEHAAAAKTDLDSAAQKVAEMKQNLATKDAERDAFIAKERADGNNIANISMKLEGERAKALARIRKAEQDRDAKQARLESLNTKKAGWENKQKDVARDMVSKVNLHPRVVNANADFIALTKHKENITNQLGLWENARTKAETHLAKLEADLKSAGITYIEEEDITGQIENIKKILEEGNKKYKDYVGRKNAADAKMAQINTYLSRWNTFKNELGRTGEDNRYENSGEQVKVKVGADRTPVMSNAPKL